MSTTITLTLASFTPGDAERITGLATAMQRDWRRRGFIPPSPFDCFALAETMVLKALSDRGIGPASAREVAAWCSAGIIWRAVQWPEAIDGDLSPLIADVPAEVLAAEEEQARQVLDRLLQHRGSRAIPTHDPHFHRKGERVAKAVFRQRGLARAIPGRFFVWWPHGEPTFHNWIDEAFSGLSDDPRYSGAAIVLDLDALGSVLLDRAGRPLVHVDVLSGEEDASQGGES